jgi:adenylate cyclase
MTCQRCHAETFAGMRFCGQCGAPLLAAENEADALSPLAVGEFKHVTVLFCDIVESTPLTERLGAEQMHELIRWFLDAGLAEVNRYEGSTPQFTGDGFLALFGAPIKHEDLVRRGARYWRHWPSAPR